MFIHVYKINTLYNDMSILQLNNNTNIINNYHVLPQRLVSHYDQVEHKLFSEAKEAEGQRKKQSQIVQKMHDELEQLKRDNAKRLKVHDF